MTLANIERTDCGRRASGGRAPLRDPDACGGYASRDGGGWRPVCAARVRRSTYGAASTGELLAGSEGKWRRVGLVACVVWVQGAKTFMLVTCTTAFDTSV